MTKISVIGAGPMGLMTAYQLLKKGHDVAIYEADDRIGGMTASFNFSGVDIERYYHFICKTDYDLFELLTELNLSSSLQWRPTKMGYFYQGKLYRWGDPVSLLTFPHLSFIQKFRYARNVMKAKSISDWKQYDEMDAITWLKKQIGHDAYHKLWHPLFQYKFFDLQENISAAWIAARVQRTAKSRKNIFQEELGYLSGGSQTLLNTMKQRILSMGGKIHLNSRINRIVQDKGCVTGLNVNGQFVDSKMVISTAPIQYIPNMLPELSASIRTKIQSINNVAVVCIICRLADSITKNFWLNINDQKIETPGLIEYSNLNPEKGHVLYAPYYLPQDHPKLQLPDKSFIDDVTSIISRVYKGSFSINELITHIHVSRYRFAQPVCQTGFFNVLPSMTTNIKNFFFADTSFCYPEDRSITESLRIAKQLVNKSLERDVMCEV